jgi:hypothetical protein
LSKFTIFAAAGGLVFIVWGIAFSRQAPQPQPQHTVESNYISLQQRWDQGHWDEDSTVLAKGPRLVQTTKIAPDAVVAAEVKELTPPEQPAHHYRKKVKRERTRSNVCSRHNMRKVMVGKYKWRCRR